MILLDVIEQSSKRRVISDLSAGLRSGGVLEYERVEFVVEVEHAVVAARLAALRDGVPLRGDYQLGLGVVALRA